MVLQAVTIHPIDLILFMREEMLKHCNFAFLSPLEMGMCPVSPYTYIQTFLSCFMKERTKRRTDRAGGNICGNCISAPTQTRVKCLWSNTYGDWSDVLFRWFLSTYQNRSCGSVDVQTMLHFLLQGVTVEAQLVTLQTVLFSLAWAYYCVTCWLFINILLFKYILHSWLKEMF